MKETSKSMKEILKKILLRRCGRREYLLTLVVLAVVCSALEGGSVNVNNIVGGFLAFLVLGSLLPLAIVGIYFVWMDGSVSYFLAMAMLGLVYITQGVRRCRDMRASVWRMFIPLYMPVALLIMEGRNVEEGKEANDGASHTLAERVRMGIAFLSPKGRLGRKGFACIFICALLSVELFFYLACFLKMLYDPTPDFKFNVSVKMSEILGLAGLLTGFAPLPLILLYDAAYVSWIMAYTVGYGFFAEAILLLVLYVLYLFQCVKRCRDMGRSWYFCLIPFYNPFVLLWREGKKEKE